ncbi:MAG: glycosyltransferase family 39 protein [Opitutaceae bacterium]|nr:glycosyltransferase family 39 protein [Opitutaceae bacterium]
MNPPSARAVPFSLALGLGLLLALGHALLATRAMREKSTTADELLHVTGGYTFNQWHDYRMHPENGALPQRWVALPLGGDPQLRYPDFNTPSWRTSDASMFGYMFFYRQGNDPGRLLARARAMNAWFGAATTLLVFLWARRLWGVAGAVVSGVLCALCPTMLAHSGVATSDMCVTLFLLLAVGAYWWHLNDGRLRVLLASAILFGLAAVAKHTSVLLLPMAAAMLLVRLFQPAPPQLGRRAFGSAAARCGYAALSLGAHGAFVGLCIWGFFGFRFSAFNPALPPGGFSPSWTEILSFDGGLARLIAWCRDWRLLPEGYLYGFAHVLRGASGRASFLDGDHGFHGWVAFFPKAFLYKTPPSLLVALLGAVLLAGLQGRAVRAGQLRAWLYRATPLIVLFVVYWIFALTSRLNIGHRHLLPTYPVLYLCCGLLGGAAVAGWRQCWRDGLVLAALVAALLGWHVRTAAGIYPHFLAYFSPLVGGPAEGYRHLVDSSLDWGQDLPGLKRWLDGHRRTGEPVHVAYFGSGLPEYYGIEATFMPTLHPFERVRPMYWPAPGLYAVSATMLQNVYLGLRGPWTAANERRYQQLRRDEPGFRALSRHQAPPPEMLAGRPGYDWYYAWAAFEQLRFVRLCHYLRARPPDAMIGYSILVYRLTQEEIDRALHGSMADLSDAMERAAGRGEAAPGAAR